MRVRVYWNLHRFLYSVQVYHPNRGWRLDRHVTQILLQNVELRVYSSGWLRALASNHRNVHAFVVGEHISYPDLQLPGVLRYDIQAGSFIDRDTGNNVKGCSFMRLHILSNGKPHMEYMP